MTGTWTVQFENDVKMYGIQTKWYHEHLDVLFENDVKMYGIQTGASPNASDVWFENDVKMYGIQTYLSISKMERSLRMM